jgi:hypothetical protein
MDPFDKFQDNFESIIIQNEFKMLSQEELNMIDAEGWSEDEYNAIRQTLISLSELDQEASNPSGEIKQNLMDIFDQLPMKEARIIRWPFWTGLGISAAAMFALLFFVVNQNTKILNPTSQIAQDISSELKTTDSAIPKAIVPVQKSETINTSASETNSHIHSDNKDVAPTSDSEMNVAAEEHMSNNKPGASPLVESSTVQEAIASSFSSNTSVKQSVVAAGSNYNWSDSEIQNSMVDPTKSGKDRNATTHSNDVPISYSLAESPELILNTVTVY